MWRVRCPGGLTVRPSDDVSIRMCWRAVYFWTWLVCGPMLTGIEQTVCRYKCIVAQCIWVDGSSVWAYTFGYG